MPRSKSRPAVEVGEERFVRFIVDEIRVREDGSRLAVLKTAMKTGKAKAYNATFVCDVDLLEELSQHCGKAEER